MGHKKLDTTEQLSTFKKKNVATVKIEPNEVMFKNF